MKRFFIFILVFSVLMFGCEATQKVAEEEMIEETEIEEEIVVEEENQKTAEMVIVVSAEFCQDLLGKTKEEVLEFFSGEMSRYTKQNDKMEEISYFEDRIQVILEEGKVSFLLFYPGVEFLGFLLTEKTTIDDVFSSFGEPAEVELYEGREYYYYDNLPVDVIFFTTEDNGIFIDVF